MLRDRLLIQRTLIEVQCGKRIRGGDDVASLQRILLQEVQRRELLVFVVGRTCLEPIQDRNLSVASS